LASSGFVICVMPLFIQPVLANDQVALYPLKETDFEALYAVASDPKIWEQHPNKDRWKREVFQIFFDGALQSNGAYYIVDKATGQVIGSTRFYDYDESDNSILIGYTFYATACWGKGINKMVKQLMLDYIFQFVDKVYFHVGASNVRSQIAMERVGGIKTGEQEVAYFGEATKLNFVYTIMRGAWEMNQSGS
jgi:N-acetyltransferase